MTDSNRIEKEIFLRAPRARVWRALTNAEEFGAWFGAKFDGGFEAGKLVAGKVTCAGYENLPMDLTVERLEPESLFSYRWHPHAVDPKADYSKEPTTLVEFRLEELPEGTRLTVIESGFDAIPAARRAEAYRMNTDGWAQELENIKRHVAG